MQTSEDQATAYRATYQPHPIPQVFRTRNKLFELLEELVGKPIVAEKYEQLIHQLQEGLPKKIRRQTLEDSVIPMVGSTPTARDLKKLAWRMAGNLPALKTHYAIPPWQSQIYDEWVPAEIRSGRRTTRGKYRGFEFDLIVLAGLPAGETMQVFWSPERAALLARRMGFTASHKRYPFRNGMELVGLRLEALIEKSLSTERPTARYFVHDDHCVGSGLLDHNRQLIKMRARIDEGYICPENFAPNQLCYLCSIGQDSCAAATHATTYTVGTCGTCGEEAYMSPDVAGQCINCAQKDAWVIKEKFRKEDR